MATPPDTRLPSRAPLDSGFDSPEHGPPSGPRVDPRRRLVKTPDLPPRWHQGDTELVTALDSELAVHRQEVGLDRLDRDEEALRDLTIRQPLCRKRRHLPLRLRERRRTAQPV